MDGASFYQQQSAVRGISTVDDVQAAAMRESAVFENLISPFLPAPGEDLIYEAATGPGILQSWLIAKGYRNLMGSDFSATEAALAAQISPRVNHCDSLTDLRERVKSEECAAIIALDLLEHLPREAFREFLEIAFSRLRPGGILILRGPNADSPLVGLNLYNDITHVWAYTTVCLTSLLRLAGFPEAAFRDDTLGGFHHGGKWKSYLMRPAKALLSGLVYVATRQWIRHWGMSIYVYARKPDRER